jgi:hypothetical protein
MQFLAWITLSFLAISGVVLTKAILILAPLYHEAVVQEVLLNSIPYLILAGMAFVFRRSASKSVVMLIASAALLYATLVNCQPVDTLADDLIIPPMGLEASYMLLFPVLIWALVMVQSADYLISKRKATQ